MRKHHNAEWAEEMRGKMPPGRYSLTLAEALELMGMDDQLSRVTAAYNYGFQRGRNYEKSLSKNRGGD